MTDNELKLAKELANTKMVLARNTMALLEYQFKEAEAQLKALEQGTADGQG